MGKLIYLMTFLGSLDPTYRDASDTSRRALLETQMMKDELRVLETEADKELYIYTGLHKEDLVYAAYAYPLFAGRLSSKPFKNFKYESKDHWIVRPEIEYVFQDHSSTAMLIFIKEF